MPRERSANRDKAFELWRDSGMKLKDIASELNVSDSQVRKWKNQDGWDERLKGNVTESKSNVTKRKGGAPKRNRNAVGNHGGAPRGNGNAVSHGFFRKIFPDNSEVNEILESIEIKSPLEILWENIVIQYVAIVRAQKLMFVTDQDDHSDFQTKTAAADTMVSEEHERQWAWDKHANFMQAQSRAMSTLESMLSRYEDMLPNSLKMEKQRLELEKIRTDIERIRNGGNSDDAEAWISALEEVAEKRRKKREHGS